MSRVFIVVALLALAPACVGPRKVSRECLERPAVQGYLAHTRERVLQAWTPPEAPTAVDVELRLVLGLHGELLQVELRRDPPPALADAVLAALEGGAPFGIMPPEAHCLFRRALTARFLPSAEPADPDAAPDLRLGSVGSR